MIYYHLGADGSFVAGDSVTRVTSYAFPTSTHATKARRSPASVAKEMLDQENEFSSRAMIGDHVQQYDERNWTRLRAHHPQMESAEESARAAALAVGNKSMRDAGRTQWCVADWNAATETLESLLHHCEPDAT